MHLCISWAQDDFKFEFSSTRFPAEFGISSTGLNGLWSRRDIFRLDQATEPQAASWQTARETTRLPTRRPWQMRRYVQLGLDAQPQESTSAPVLLRTTTERPKVPSP